MAKKKLKVGSIIHIKGESEATGVVTHVDDNQFLWEEFTSYSHQGTHFPFVPYLINSNFIKVTVLF